MKQARRHIFQPTFPPATKHTCRGGGGVHTSTKMGKGKGGEKNTSKLFPQLSALLVLTCRYLTGDVSNCRQEKQESREHREKCIHVFKRGRALAVRNSFPPSPTPKSFLFFFFFFPPPLLLRPLLPRLRVSSGSLFSALFLLLSAVQPLHTLLSPGFCLFCFQRALSRGHHTLFHAEGVREREGGRARERERERESQRQGERAQRGECVTSRGGSWLNKK